MFVLVTLCGHKSFWVRADVWSKESQRHVGPVRPRQNPLESRFCIVFCQLTREILRANFEYFHSNFEFCNKTYEFNAHGTPVASWIPLISNSQKSTVILTS
jgi:hypothetical protein